MTRKRRFGCAAPGDAPIAIPGFPGRSRLRKESVPGLVSPLDSSSLTDLGPDGQQTLPVNSVLRNEIYRAICVVKASNEPVLVIGPAPKSIVPPKYPLNRMSPLGETIRLSPI